MHPSDADIHAAVGQPVATSCGFNEEGYNAVLWLTQACAVPSPHS